MKHINLKTLMKRAEHDLQAVQESIQTFLDATPDRLRLLQEAIQLEHAHSVEHVAHAIKGSLAAYGATQIIAKASEIESMAGRGELDAAEESLNELCQLLDELYDDLWYVMSKKASVKVDLSLAAE